MMANVTEFKREVDRVLIKKLFHKFTSVYGHIWSSRHKSDSEWEECCTTWYDGLHAFELEVIRKSVIRAIAIHKEFPPTLGQLIDICLKVSGIPSDDDVIESMIRRDFNHPLIKVVFDRVGNWALAHGKSEDIKAKVKNVYGECLVSFRENPTKAWDELESFKQQQALPPPPPKIPSKEECISFRERMRIYQEQSIASKLAMGEKSHPVWPADEIKTGGKHFDKDLFSDRRKYLIELDEMVAGTLSHEDNYDRIRFLRERESARHLQNVGYTGRRTEDVKEAPRGHKASKTIFKNWMGD